MNAKLKNGKLIIELDVHDAKPSTTGKTLGVAGTQGRFQTSVTIDGQPLWIIANAFIYGPSKAKKEEETEESGDKRRKATKLASIKMKPVVIEEDEEEEVRDDDEN